MGYTSVKQLYIYPVKSLGGVAVPSIKFNTCGPIDDRRYMLVNQEHRFLTQRSHSILSQFHLSQTDGGWQVKAPNGERIVILDNDSTDQTINTSVWKTPLQTREKSTRVSQWFSEHLDEWVHLVELDDLETRYCRVGAHQVPFGFADGYPLLICNETSLNELSRSINYPLDMSRFRPNVVVSLDAGDEYYISELRVDAHQRLLIAEPCVRCNIPAIDPHTSVYQKQIHSMLKTELKRDNKVVFGVNALALNFKTISVGDQLEIVK